MVSILQALAAPQPRLGARLAALAALHDVRGPLLPARDDPVLHTPDLQLRPAAPADAAQLAGHWSDAQVARFLFDGHALGPAGAAGLVQAGSAAAARRCGGLWMASAGGQTVGAAALLQLSRDTAMELIVSLVPACWGRGLAAQAGSRLLQHGLHDLGLGVIVADMNLPNPRLQRLALRLGMRIERRLSRPGLHYYFIDRKTPAPAPRLAGPLRCSCP